ncbi:hypothetical protein M5K25_016031 [Dendrobium thyrsiflorum]|uniref:Uncharacterized protein n=1 Tax=Dendrobium thyrsiflorum TaxID=117978 RepID=A0ABD0URZ1_DENTH
MGLYTNQNLHFLLKAAINNYQYTSQLIHGTLLSGSTPSCLITMIYASNSHVERLRKDILSLVGKSPCLGFFWEISTAVDSVMKILKDIMLIYSHEECWCNQDRSSSPCFGCLVPLVGDCGG